MKKQVKVAIQDENTLQLLEDAQRGDLIDLKSLHESDIDKTSLENLIKAIRNEEFDAQIEAAKKSIGKEKALEAELKEKDIISRAKEALLKKDQEIASLSIKVDNIAKQVESDAKLKALQEKKALEDEYQKTLTQKEAEIQEVKHEKELEKQK